MLRSSGPPPAPAPPAARASVRGWRDPRLWVGVALVALSVVAGARLLAAADDTVQVWSVRADHGAGDRLTADDLVATRVRFADDADLAAYLPVEEPLPADARLTRALGAGELLPRAALGDADEVGTVELPVAVDPLLLPPSVGPGSVVDVYLRPGTGSARPVDEVAPVLEGVTVLEAPAAEAVLGAASGQRQLVLAVPEDDVPGFFAQLGSGSDRVLTVVGQR